MFSIMHVFFSALGSSLKWAAGPGHCPLRKLWQQLFFLGQFLRQHKAAYERNYLAIGVLKLYDMITKILA